MLRVKFRFQNVNKIKAMANSDLISFYWFCQSIKENLSRLQEACMYDQTLSFIKMNWTNLWQFQQPPSKGFGFYQIYQETMQ